MSERERESALARRSSPLPPLPPSLLVRTLRLYCHVREKEERKAARSVDCEASNFRVGDGGRARRGGGMGKSAEAEAVGTGRERESVWVGEFKQPRERDWRKHSIRILRQLLTPWRVGVQLETVGFAKFASVKRLMERRHVDNVFALHSVCTRGGDDKAADSHAVAKLAKFLPTQTCSAKSRFG